MSDDFRQEVKREWRWQLFDEAVQACDKACDKFWRHLEEVRLRPPCRICGNWPCVCRG